MGWFTQDPIDPNEYAAAVAEATRRGGGDHQEARTNGRQARRDIKRQEQGRKGKR